MRVIIIDKKKVIFYIILLVIIVISLFLMSYKGLFQNNSNTKHTIMGGQFNTQSMDLLDKIQVNKIEVTEKDVEKYFRPSNLPVLNDRDFESDFFKPYYTDPSEVTLPDDLLGTPEDTIINYFSILREASLPEKGNQTGCGTIGHSGSPYPIAYNFFTSAYQERFDFSSYFKSFRNILHFNLIKVKEIPSDENHPNDIRYFIEFETIEGSEKDVAYFAYYYGYIYISKDGPPYKISDIQIYGENYLCAPYHGWSYMAEYIVDVKYGNWCSLVKERYPTQQEGYVKTIYFKGKDGADYLFIFFQLTNDTDIEIAQYKKTTDNKWELIRLDPTKCLDN